MHPECPDYDLCEKCESAPFPVHPETHPMLKTKVPLRINAQTTLETAEVVNTRRASKAFEGCRQARDARKTCGKPMQVQVNRPVPATPKSTPPKAESELRIPGGYNGKSVYEEEVEFKGQAPLVPDNRDTDIGRRLLERINAMSIKAAQSPEKAEKAVATGFVKSFEAAMAAATGAAAAESVEKVQQKEVAPTVEEKVAAEPVKEEMISEDTKEDVVADEEASAVEIKQEVRENVLPRSVKTIYPASTTVTPLDICSWVRHRTMGPGETLPVGAEFTKTWRMKHFASGSEFDFKTLRLVLQSEGVCGEACENVNVQLRNDDIKDDEEIEVSIHGLRVPDRPGQEVVEHWRFVDEKGVSYGQPLRLR